MRQVVCFLLLVALAHAAVERKTRQAYYGNGGYGGYGGGLRGGDPFGTFGGLQPGQGVVYNGYGNDFGIPGLKPGDEVVYEGVVGNGFQGYGGGYQGYGGYQGFGGYY